MANRKKGIPYRKKERALRKSLLSEVWDVAHQTVEMHCERGESPELSLLMRHVMTRIYSETSLRMKDRYAPEYSRSEASAFDAACKCAKFAGIPTSHVQRYKSGKRASLQMRNRTWLFEGSFVGVQTRYGIHYTEYNKNVRYIVPYLDSLMPRVEEMVGTITRGMQKRAMIRKIELVTERSVHR